MNDTLGDRLEELVAERTAVLRESAERFRALVDVMAEIVWTTDAQGVVVEDSPLWRAFTGQTLQEWLGWGWLDAVHPADREYADRQWREAVERRTLVDTQFRLWHAVAEEWQITRVRAVPLFNLDGSIRCWVGMNTVVRAADQVQLGPETRAPSAVPGHPLGVVDSDDERERSARERLLEWEACDLNRVVPGDMASVRRRFAIAMYETVALSQSLGMIEERLIYHIRYALEQYRRSE